MQAIGSMSQKRRQLSQIKDFINYSVNAVLRSGTIESPENLIVLLAGDFNMDAYDEENFAVLMEELGSPRDLHREQNPLKKEYTMTIKMFNMYKRFDYIWAFDNLETVPLRKVRIQTINATDVRDHNQISISDHTALKTSLVFDKTKITEKIEYSNRETQAK
jgi:endonuclease/exonuclease/phosphatase family metal-dependent hydrolase